MINKKKKTETTVCLNFSVCFVGYETGFGYIYSLNNVQLQTLSYSAKTVI